MYEKILILICMFALLPIVLGVGTGNKKKKKKLLELKIMERGKEEGIVFGRLGKKKVVVSPSDREGHVAAFAGSGQGKTSALGIESLRKFRGNVFVIDISGDISKNVEKKNKIVYKPENKETIPYNIFYPIDILESVEEQNEALEQLCFRLMPENPNMSDASIYFLNNGRKIFTAALIAFYHQGMDFIEICRKVIGTDVVTLFEEIDKTKNENAILYINGFIGTNEKNTSGCKQAVDDALKLFVTNASVKNAIRRPKEGEISLNPTLIETENIFIIISDEKLELYAPLLNIIVSQLMQYISNRIVNNSSKFILLFLDEFASLRIDSDTILQALRKYRKKKCRIMLLSQSTADLDLLYNHDTTRALLSNFRFKVLLGGLGDTDSQKFFAEMIGYKDAKKKSVSKSANSHSITESENREYIIEPAELDRMGNKLVLISPDGEGYMILEKNFYFKK